MTRKLLGLAVLVVAAVAVWFFGVHRHALDTAPSAGTRKAAVAPTVTPAGSTDAPAPRGGAPRWTLDLDPEGPLRLEGQVVGPDGGGVGGAEVSLDAVPPRTTKSEQDGSFSFDKLVGRSYNLAATSNTLIGGPVEYKLTTTSDPVVIRLAAGAKLVVTVVEEDARPIAGAEVKLESAGEHVTKTGDDGRATVAPVHPGWVAVEVTAAGHAPAGGFSTIGSAGATGQLRVTLHRGVAVTGRVVDESGKPVAKAHVAPTGMWDLAGAGSPVITDDKGQFTVAALAAGSHTLTASDGDHAPARSSPITVADRPVAGVEIVMKQGGVVAGTVVLPDGKPVPFATIRVAGKADEMSRVPSRQATTDRAGKFELRGLSRAKLQARAESDTAASQLVDVDLVQPAAKRDLRLVLDVAGTISGSVIDENGQPVPEVSVNAFPDFTSGTSGEGLAGMSSATTDGAGGFVIRGIPEGSYRLSAARRSGAGRDWGQQGTPAKTGDKGVKIVLAAPGIVVGKIALDGSAAPPKLTILQLGYQPGTPAAAGEFRLEDVTPGTYDLHVLGPEFAELVTHDVKIEPGKTTDLGTITVFRGRTLVGKVVDGSGTAVAGAKVKVGDMLFTMQGAEEAMANFDDVSGARVAITDQDGAFTLIGIPKKRTSVMADQPDRGRSNAVEIAEGADDPPPITLALRGFGSIAGKVTQKGQPVTGAMVNDTPKGGGAQLLMTQTADDGTFTLAKVVEGTNVLSAMQQQGLGMSLKSTSATVQVVAGKQTSVVIDIPVGTITLVVQVQALPNNKVDAAQVFLFHGSVTATNAQQLTDGFLQGGVQGMKIWFGAGKPLPEFDELVPAEYSVCTVPITGDITDPTLQQRLGEHMDLLKVYCKQVTVAASPVTQTLVDAVPAMTPLPTPKT